MARWIKKQWIEKALQTEDPSKLPKNAKAQVIKFIDLPDDEDRASVAVISDKQFTVKAIFSVNSIQIFGRKNDGRVLGSILGGLVFLNKYSVHADATGKGGCWEFVIFIDEFTFAGGDGNTPFGSMLIYSSTHLPLQASLERHQRQAILGKKSNDEANCLASRPDKQEPPDVLLQMDYQSVFIPQEQKEILRNLPEWSRNFQQGASMESSSCTFMEGHGAVETCFQDTVKKGPQEEQETGETQETHRHGKSKGKKPSQHHGSNNHETNHPLRSAGCQKEPVTLMERDPDTDETCEQGRQSNCETSEDAHIEDSDATVSGRDLGTSTLINVTLQAGVGLPAMTGTCEEAVPDSADSDSDMSGRGKEPKLPQLFEIPQTVRKTNQVAAGGEGLTDSVVLNSQYSQDEKVAQLAQLSSCKVCSGKIIKDCNSSNGTLSMEPGSGHLVGQGINNRQKVDKPTRDSNESAATADDPENEQTGKGCLPRVPQRPMLPSQETRTNSSSDESYSLLDSKWHDFKCPFHPAEYSGTNRKELDKPSGAQGPSVLDIPVKELSEEPDSPESQVSIAQLVELIIQEGVKNDSSNESYSLLDSNPQGLAQPCRTERELGGETTCPPATEAGIEKSPCASDIPQTNKHCSLSDSQLEHLFQQSSFCNSDLESPVDNNRLQSNTKENAQPSRTGAFADDGRMSAHLRLRNDCSVLMDKGVHLANKELGERANNAPARPSGNPGPHPHIGEGEGVASCSSESSCNFTSSLESCLGHAFTSDNAEKQVVLMTDFDRLVQRNTWDAVRGKDPPSLAADRTGNHGMGKRKIDDEDQTLNADNSVPAEGLTQCSSVAGDSDPLSTASLSQSVPLHSQQESLVLLDCSLDDSPALSHPDTEETTKSPKRRCTEESRLTAQNSTSSPEESPLLLETSSDEPVTLKTPSTSSLQSHQVFCSTPRGETPKLAEDVSPQSVVPKEILDYLAQFRKKKARRRPLGCLDLFSVDL